MSKEKHPPASEQDKLLEELRRYGKKASAGLFGENNGDFDERELASGSEKLLDKSDAELFPDEAEEYTPEERKPRVVIDNSDKKT